jgi:A/G-specific adenine glycosylase
MQFSNTLIYWYLQNRRDLPWRKTKNPYLIWLSEIILQQTRIDQGLDYYLRFSEHFPTIYDLANEEEETILKLWQGLGYYSRARNLHFSAKYIVNQLNGKFPTTYAELLKLKGVGDYTASAIASICYNEPTAVVDGNVYRVLARYFGIDTPINSSKGIKDFKKLAQSLINVNDPGDYNQAIMEFGAKQCKPQNPNCAECPLNNSCLALQQKRINILPVKKNKIKIKHRYFNYIVINNDETILQQRKTKGIWQNLYEFPLIESNDNLAIEELITSEQFELIFKGAKTSVKLHNQKPIIHKLSHQHLYTKFWIVESSKSFDNSIPWDDFEKYPVPILIHNFVSEFKSDEY